MLKAGFVLAASLVAWHGAEAQNPTDGQRLYTNTCGTCHQADGQGLEGKFPPLAGSEWVEDEGKLVRIILNGLTGPIEVSGVTYSSAMAGLGSLGDLQISAIASYVRAAWGNKSAAVSVHTVSAIRKATASRTTPWTAAELAEVIKPRKSD